MKIAVTYNNGQIFGNFGHTEQFLAENNIKVYPGIEGNADIAVEKLINGTLEFNPEIQCDHHNHEHEHDCSADKGGCNGNK